MIHSIEEKNYQIGVNQFIIGTLKISIHDIYILFKYTFNEIQIVTNKLEWNAKSKVGSLQNASYKPGGGDKKIETVKLDFGEKAKSKVGSTANITHKPGGGAIKVIT
ncbi:hypothetical protein F3G58_34660 [Pseudomonas aeruginosa]|nr:hypothetical protein F3G58_34660 [Pseudomonas aeruginosa]